MNKALLGTLLAAAAGGGLYLVVGGVRQPEIPVVDVADGGIEPSTPAAGSTAAKGQEKEGIDGKASWRERYLALQEEKAALERRLVEEEKAVLVLQEQLETLTRTGGEIRSALESAGDGEIAPGTAELLQRQQEELQVTRGTAEGLRRGLNSVLGNLAGIEEKAARAEEEKARATRALEQLKETLQSDLGQQQAQFSKKRDSSTLIQLESDLIFAEGSSDLSWQGEATLDKIAVLLDRFPGYTVSLEGHTDDRQLRDRLKKKYPSNWELSAARAAAAARYLTWRGINPSRLRVVGHGPFRPRADNDTPEGRASNRRLEIVLQQKSLPVEKVPLEEAARLEKKR